jgi:capsule biosynthesis phosphatase
LKTHCDAVILGKIQFKGEYYTSCVVGNLLEAGVPVRAIPITDFQCVGTPDQLKAYCLSGKEPTPPLRVCFDLDDTLVRCPIVGVGAGAGTSAVRAYDAPVPIEHNIAYLRHLKSRGHTIIIHTARRMKTHAGCEGAAIKDIAAVTLKTLEDLDIPYDELYFGKPYADFYIDDKAVNAAANLDKALGVYMNAIAPRSFNHIEVAGDTIVKTGDASTIRGEVHFYQSIPAEVADLFPAFMGEIAGGSTGYRLEYVQSINLAFHFVNGDLTPQAMSRLCGALRRLHSLAPANRVDPYDHYEARLDKRCNAIHPESERIHRALKAWFKRYRERDGAIIGVIHGDPVFSNVLMTADGRFKFIDMLGLLGDRLSIYGDVMYDYAKVYQSLLGYDEAMHQKYVSTTLTSLLRRQLLDYVAAVYGSEYVPVVQVIAYSHIYTLLPLHDSSKAGAYAQLIDIDHLTTICMIEEERALLNEESPMRAE